MFKKSQVLKPPLLTGQTLCLTTTKTEVVIGSETVSLCISRDYLLLLKCRSELFLLTTCLLRVCNMSMHCYSSSFFAITLGLAHTRPVRHFGPAGGSALYSATHKRKAGPSRSGIRRESSVNHVSWLCRQNVEERTDALL